MSLVAGCAVVGPKAVKGGRTQYNLALNQTADEELLLNIVRMRHADRPYFLQVSSISATSEANAALGGSEEKGAIGGIGYLERPNIIYIPLSGEEMVTQLLTPVEISALQLLRGAGWEFDDILRVFVSSLNGLQNAPTAASATPEGVPKYKDFLAVVEAIDELEDRGMLELSRVRRGEAEQVLMYVSPQGRDSGYFRTMVAALELDRNAEYYEVAIGLHVPVDSATTIVVDTRPILASMFYLGQSIQFPQEVLESGVVKVNHHPGGEPFDWKPVFEELMVIKVATRDPGDRAEVAVAYRGYWYYIERTDIDSKETLSMLATLIALKAGGKAAADPVLTLPVGG